MKTKDEPEFLCRHCSECMCDDCKSIAEEYEHLLMGRTRELENTNENNRELKLENQLLKQQLEDWKRFSKLGYEDIIQAWVDEQMSKDAIKRARFLHRMELISRIK